MLAEIPADSTETKNKQQNLKYWVLLSCFCYYVQNLHSSMNHAFVNTQVNRTRCYLNRVLLNYFKYKVLDDLTELELQSEKQSQNCLTVFFTACRTSLIFQQ